MPLIPPPRPFLDWAVDTRPDDWDMVETAIIGLPLSEHYPGEPRPNDQAAAPDAIRAQSGQFCDGPAHWDFDIGAPLSRLLPSGGRDAGNLIEGDAAFDAHFAESIAVMKRHIATSRFSAVLGGDHGVTIPTLHALEVLGRPVHLVQIDAHIDWRDDVGGVRRGYSSPIRRASELPWISGITQIGIRGTGSARSTELEAARDHGATIFTAHAIHDEGLAPVLAHLAGRGPFFLTVDADGLDPSVMPAVLGPVPGGLRFEQVRRILCHLAAEGGLRAMDVVEVAPSVDLPNAITSVTAGRLLINGIGAALGGTA
ncbi:arginase [Aliigemmobacter aestuarii]|uniref:Arginase n=1 Tax=Aliigemmobacter aestuarii TaxID=1445661 RepID=A0A4S3MRS4_9RHOB|nr:arginase family protein [Gemmobacter aestuarii]THD84793.1 arginase [Gemmobacter aestuarii]